TTGAARALPGAASPKTSANPIAIICFMSASSYLGIRVPGARHRRNVVSCPLISCTNDHGKDAVVERSAVVIVNLAVQRVENQIGLVDEEVPTVRLEREIRRIRTLSTAAHRRIRISRKRDPCPPLPAVSSGRGE